MKFCLNFNYLFVGIYVMLSWSSLCSTNLTKEYSSYRRLPLCKPSEDIRYPKSADDVVEIVNEAISKGLTVKAFGSRHSQTDIICTEGIPVDMKGIRYFEMNLDNTATIGAGAVLRDATEFLRKYNRALRTTPAYGNITIGGAIGTGSHGSTIKYNATLSSQVIGMTIVNGEGMKQNITDPQDLKAFRIHLGLLGIVIDVTLYTVELYKMRAHNYAVPDDILTNGVAIDYAKNTDQIALYWFPAFKEVVVANWTIVDVDTPGNGYTSDHVPSTYENLNLVATLAKEIVYGLTESTCAVANSFGYTLLHVFEYFLELTLLVPVPDWVPIYASEKGSFENPSVGYYDKMIAPICYDEPQGILGTGCLWSHGVNSITILDNEFSLDLADLPAFIVAVKDILKKTPAAFPLQGILIRFTDKLDIYMSPAYGRQTAHFEFYLWNPQDMYKQPSASLAGYQTILQTLTRRFNGRSHWGKSGLVYHNSEFLDLKLDPIARKNFIDAMDTYDPNEIFINNFGRRLKQKGTKVDFDSLTTHCALLDNCICEYNYDCGTSQICTKLPGYPYRVCKTKNELPEKTIDTSTFPPPIGLPPPIGFLTYLQTVVPTLVTNAISNCSIGEAAGTAGSLFSFNPIDNGLRTVRVLAEKLSELRTPGKIIKATGDVFGAVING